MTDQPDPSVKSGATAAVAAASPPPAPTPTTGPADDAPPIDTTHAAPGPLFAGTPVAGTPWTGGRAPYADSTATIVIDSEPDALPVELADVEVPVGPFVPLKERPAAMLGSGPAAVFPVANGPTRAVLGSDVVTCPECGLLATVDLARRQADDFCRRCDFPLFWARGIVITPEGEESGASLRRLPGTVGRAATAALICPHCSEPNSPAAEICVRCALSLHPVDIPEPEPVVFVPTPEPEPEPEPERGFDWWWIVALAAALIGIALVIGLLYLR